MIRLTKRNVLRSSGVAKGPATLGLNTRDKRSCQNESWLPIDFGMKLGLLRKHAVWQLMNCFENRLATAAEKAVSLCFVEGNSVENCQSMFDK